jgi:transcriptional regulator PpsR
LSIVKQFDAPKESLGNLDAEAAGMLIAASADVALVVDAQGVIRDLAFGSEELLREGYAGWIGRSWIETVTVESRPKVEALLRETSTSRSCSTRRHINHPSARGQDVPVLYSAVQVGSDGRSVAVGRDLRAIAALQQRLVEAQQSMERDYWRLRHVETRYRLLFQMGTEGVLVVDATSQRITEANPAAIRLLGEGTRRLVGRTFPDGFAPEGTQAVQALLGRVRGTGRADQAVARLAGAGEAVEVSVSLFRQDNTSLFLVRIASGRPDAADTALPKAQSAILKVLESAPDGFVVTDPEGRIITANAAFLELAQVATEEQARGESLGRWLGRPGVDLGVLVANLKQHGSVRLFATTLRGTFGANADVEISGVSVVDGEEPCLGFTIHNVGPRLTGESRPGRDQPRSVEQLSELVGRVPLKDLVREATDLIEKLCIEAALELTRDNRASAAEMLGLSRQSLYVKLRRYGVADLSGDRDS